MNHLNHNMLQIFLISSVLVGFAKLANICENEINLHGKSETNCGQQSLTTVPDSSVPKGTEILLLNFNNLKFIATSSFSGFPGLIKLDLSNNGLTKLDSSYPLPLEELNLSNNSLTQFPSLNNFKSLTKIFLAHNSIPEIPDEGFRGLDQLKEIDLQRNQIAFLSDQVFEDLHKLEILDLSYNQLRNLPRHLVSSLNKLVNFHLSGNRLTELPDHFFDGLGDLAYIYLHENPWNCNCALEYLQTWVTDNDYNIYIMNGTLTVNAPESVTCASPWKLRGTPISSFSIDHCKKAVDSAGEHIEEPITELLTTPEGRIQIRTLLPKSTIIIPQLTTTVMRPITAYRTTRASLPELTTGFMTTIEPLKKTTVKTLIATEKITEPTTTLPITTKRLSQSTTALTEPTKTFQTTTVSLRDITTTFTITEPLKELTTNSVITTEKISEPTTTFPITTKRQSQPTTAITTTRQRTMPTTSWGTTLKSSQPTITHTTTKEKTPSVSYYLTTQNPVPASQHIQFSTLQYTSLTQTTATNARTTDRAVTTSNLSTTELVAFTSGFPTTMEILSVIGRQNKQFGTLGDFIANFCCFLHLIFYLVSLLIQLLETIVLIAWMCYVYFQYYRPIKCLLQKPPNIWLVSYSLLNKEDSPPRTHARTPDIKRHTFSSFKETSGPAPNVKRMSALNLEIELESLAADIRKYSLPPPIAPNTLKM